MVHLPYHWSRDDEWKDRVMRPSRGGDHGSGGMEDDRVERHPDPQYQTDADAAAAAVTHQGEECVVCAGVDF